LTFDEPDARLAEEAAQGLRACFGRVRWVPEGPACQDSSMAPRLKVLLPDGTVKRFPPDSKRQVTDGNLSIRDGSGAEIASFPKGGWQAVGRMRIASEASDDEE
jgi:hypothetical protein